MHWNGFPHNYFGLAAEDEPKKLLCILSSLTVIFLSFEFPVYDLLETQFEEFYEDVTVIKSNNLMTEQQLQIWFQLESPMNTTIPPATRDMDYLFGTQMAQGRQFLHDELLRNCDH